MREDEAYVGFPPLPEKSEIVQALLNDPPNIRWRVVRDLFRIEDPNDREDLTRQIESLLSGAEDMHVRYRLTLALDALGHPLQNGEYLVARGLGAVRASELSVLAGSSGSGNQGQGCGEDSPVVDFHIHPKSPDLKFFTHLRQAGVTHAVILATDTDRADADRKKIGRMLKKQYSRSAASQYVPFQDMLEQIRKSLYSPTHVTNQDVADWVRDYPDVLFGFGSVNPSKDSAYVEETLDEIEHLGLKGIKLLPFSQFFNPAGNGNVKRILKRARKNNWIILSHTGCGPGPFEIPELSENARPRLWEPHVRKYPDVPFVLAHFGSYSTQSPGIWLRDAMGLGKRYRNVYADLAGVNWLMAHTGAVEGIRETIGFDKVLFATDYPVPLASGVSLSRLVESIHKNRLLTDDEKRKVLGENAARLLHIERPVRRAHLTL